MPDPRAEKAFDPQIADAFLQANEKLGGLPKYLGVRFIEYQPGLLRAELAVRDELLTMIGNLHGGVLAALCDHLLGCVCYPHMKRGQWAATTEFKLNLLAPVSGGTLEAEAEIVSLSRSLAVVCIEIRNGERRACIAQGTVMIMDPKKRA